MLADSLSRIEALPSELRVLDVGGWACPLARADVVLDYMPWESRGLYGFNGERSAERFTPETWVQHDICHRTRWPFEDDTFDLVVCSHTLEDIRDPVWVASELSRVARAGYVEVPSRLEEQAWGVNGDYAGWSHHHWLIDIDQSAQHMDFVFKPHSLHARGYGWNFSASFGAALTPAERVSTLWWEGSFTAAERWFPGIDEIVAYLREPVRSHGARDPGDQGPRLSARVAPALRRLRAAATRPRAS